MTEFIGLIVIYGLAVIGARHIHEHYMSTKDKAREAEAVKRYTDQQSTEDQDAP